MNKFEYAHSWLENIINETKKSIESIETILDEKQFYINSKDYYKGLKQAYEIVLTKLTMMNDTVFYEFDTGYPSFEIKNIMLQK